MRLARPVALSAVILAACGSSPAPPILANNGFEDAGADTSSPSLSGGPVSAPTDDPITCAEAATLRSYIGCDYWPTVVANDVWSIFDYAVVVANAGAVPALVTITGPSGTNQSQTVQPNALAKFFLPWVPALKGGDTDACGTAVPLAASVVATASAYHLVSSVPVTVYQFNALEYAGQGGPTGKSWAACPGVLECTDSASPNFGLALGCFSFTNDSSLLLPSTAMTGNYRVTGYSGESVPLSAGAGPTPVMNAYMAITGTTALTHVTVTLSSTAHVLAGGSVVDTAAGGTITLTLGAGDVAELVSALGDAVDLSGSLVTADHPVQVITGAPCAEVPETAAACDHLEQSVFPAETLGKQYFVSVPTGPLGAGVAHVVRFYGNVDGTTLSYSPAAPAGCPTALSAGQVVDCGEVSRDFEVIGSNEFAIGTFMLGGSIVDPTGGLGDPSESLVVAVEQYRTKYVFLAPDDYAVSYADIVGPLGTEISLDGALLGTSVLTPLADGYGVTSVALPATGAHVLLASQPVGVQVEGYGAYTSYQYPGGLNLKQIAPPPPTPK